MLRIYTKLRAIIGIPIFVFATLVLSTMMIIVGILKLRKLQDWVAINWGSFFIYLFGIRVEMEGAENLPEDQGVLFLFNHQSLVDIPVLFHLIHSCKSIVAW